MRTITMHILRKLRMQKNELLYDMAKKLGVSSSELSLVEWNKQPMPKEWISKIKGMYPITEQELDTLVKESEKNATRFEVVMTSDAFADSEDAFAIWDNKYEEYCTDKCGKVFTYETEKAAEQGLRLVQCLIDNGIDQSEVQTVLQALGYILLDAELYPETDGEHFIY